MTKIVEKARSTALQGILLCGLIGLAIVLWGKWYVDSVPPRNIETLMKREGIKGAVLAIRRTGGTLNMQVIGHSHLPDEALTASSRLPIASLSKPLTAAAIRRLAAQGSLDLNAHPFLLMPGLPRTEDERYNHITIRQLLQHTSGLNQTPDDPMFHNGMPTGCKVAINKTLRRDLESDPGTRMRYSNTGYCLLATLIEHTTGMDYVAAIHVLLGLSADSPLTLGPPAPGTPHEGYALPEHQWAKNGAAGGWFSDAGTLATVFSRDVQDPGIATPATTACGDWYYGLGWRVWPQAEGYRLTHYGALPGMFSVAVGYPDGRVAVLLMNGRPQNEDDTAERLYSMLDAMLMPPRP